jgi:hypothetical protein
MTGHLKSPVNWDGASDDEYLTTHTCSGVGKAVKEVMAPITQPVIRNGFSKRVPVASAGRCHGHGGLCSELLISPMGLGEGVVLKQTSGWSPTIALLAFLGLKGVSWEAGKRGQSCIPGFLDRAGLA